MMNRYVKIIVSVVLIAAVLALMVFQSHNKVIVRDFVFNQDAKRIDTLFHKEDNWYWLISDYSSKTYSVDFMLRHKTSSQQERLHDLVIKVMEIDGNIAGFLAYYPHSYYVWQLLFLAVDQDYRRQGVAKKLLKYAVDDMVKRGALRVELATRVNNARARSLYSNFGFKLLSTEEEFAHFSWNKK